MTLDVSDTAFDAAYAAGRPQILYRRLVDDLETPVSAYLKMAHGRPYSFLFESVEGGAWRGRYSAIVMAPELVWRCRGDRAEIARDEGQGLGAFEPDPEPALDSLKRLIAQSRMDLPEGLPAMTAGVFGVLGYDMIRLAERLGEPNPDPLDLPDGILVRPSLMAIFDAIAQEILLVAVVRPSARSAAQARAAAETQLFEAAEALTHPLPRSRGRGEPSDAPVLAPGLERAAYGDLVARAKAYIRGGDIFQVVPSHRFSMDFDLPPFSLYRSLRRTNPSPFLFHLAFPDFTLIGSSPEILVRVRDRKITIRPIAGTRPRGETPEEDAALEADLLADEKERAEHLMLLDLGRNDVGRIALLRDAGGNAPPPAGPSLPRVRVTQSFTVERYSHVMHIVSTVEGDAPEGLDPVEALLAALPAGTLSGAPKIRAMEIIDELESVKRGVAYAGAVGYFGADGSLDTCIVLRTGLIKDGKLYVQAGGGVVADSDPDTEYDETLHKSRALARAAAEAWRF